MSYMARRDFIDALRRLADLLDEHPEIPTPDYPRILALIDLDAWDRLDRLAAYLQSCGIDIDDETRRDARTITLLDGLYHVISHTRKGMAEYEAKQSYVESVQP